MYFFESRSNIGPYVIFKIQVFGRLQIYFWFVRDTLGRQMELFTYGDYRANTSSEYINECLKMYACTRKKYPHRVTINLQLQNRPHSSLRSRRVRCKRTTRRINFKIWIHWNACNHYDNLPTALKTISLLSTLQYLSELWKNK